MVIDLSAIGTRLSVGAETDVPPEFTAIFPASETRHFRLVWRSGQDIGVEFLPVEFLTGAAYGDDRESRANRFRHQIDAAVETTIVF